MQLTTDQALIIGRDADQFLNSKSFRKIVEILEEDIRIETFQSKPHESEKRELLYMRHKALEELIITLRHMAQTAVAITEAEETENE